MAFQNSQNELNIQNQTNLLESQANLPEDVKQLSVIEFVNWVCEEQIEKVQEEEVAVEQETERQKKDLVDAKSNNFESYTELAFKLQKA